MRAGKGPLLLLATVVLVGATLALVDGILRSFNSDVGSFLGCLSALEREQEVSQQLDEAFQRTLVNAAHKNQVMKDLVAGHCDLVKAVARYRELCRSGDLLSFRAMYRLFSAPEQEVVARHLILLVHREWSGRPEARAEVVSRLENEAKLLGPNTSAGLPGA